ncbi:TVP38/TMEM64 family protein [Alkalihalobacillus sp. R86527]|uniref:TVP38/TMEM64 family protein n=1 Tax=Alkalihalobacillus sp. R86527 TaxID=3093863 RepID=UPI00367059DC
MLFSTSGLEDLKAFMLGLGNWGPIVAIFLMVLHSIIFIPSEIILFANVYIFGLTFGLIYTWIGSMLGAYLSFYLARLFGRPLVLKVISDDKLAKFDNWFKKNGLFGLFLLRLVPLFSFNLLNYGAGLISITLWQFTWTTALGIIPPMFIMAWLYMNSMQSSLGVAILIVVVVLFIVIKVFKDKLIKVKSKEIERDHETD